MKFISLTDLVSHNVITINANAFVLRLEIDGQSRETRLNPYHGEILYALFNKHPVALEYEEITALLRMHNLVVTDSTRIHRKLSEIRSFLIAFHPSLNDLVFNTRGIGYSLPLRLKNLHHLESNKNIQFKNSKIAKSITIIKGLIEDIIDLTSKSEVIKHAQGYIINRNPVLSVLVEKIAVFNRCEQTILEQICAHEADFIYIRMLYLLAKLRTYIGLARISEYPISEAQWLDWFKQEIWLLFDDLKKLIKLAEPV